VIIISDDITGREFPKYVCGDPVTLMHIDACESLDTPLVVMDVDFSNLETVSRLRALLSAGNKPVLLAAVADPANHRARTQAWALGATRLVPAPLDIAGLTQLARSAAANNPDMIQCQTSVMYAAGSLEQAFGALRAHANLDMTQISKSSGEITGAIARSSLANWLGTVRAYHEGTFQHCLIVTGVATAVGYHAGMSTEDIGTLTNAGLLHDIGKVEIPAAILDKPGKLTPEEYDVIKTHPAVGYDYLAAQGSVSPEILSAVHHHHEFLDGSGYPDGLQGAEIGDVTRILTVCDIYGALVETRAYKQSVAPPEAIDILIGMADAGKVERALVNMLAGTVGVEAA